MILGIFIAAIAVFVLINKSYYPSLPIDGISARGALDILKESESKIAKIAVEGDYIWYITSSEKKGISSADENIKQMVVSYGWEFEQKDGSGLFFEKGEERLIVTTQMWTENYVLAKIPSNLGDN